MKIAELAKELKMTGEEVLEKAKAMGVPVAKTSDDMSDMDTVAVRNTLTKGSGKAETKEVTKTVTAKAVNLRAEGNPSAKILKVLKKGAEVKVLKEGKSWDKVEYKGVTGWVYKKYIK